MIDRGHSARKLRCSDHTVVSRERLYLDAARAQSFIWNDYILIKTLFVWTGAKMKVLARRQDQGCRLDTGKIVAVDVSDIGNKPKSCRCDRMPSDSMVGGATPSSFMDNGGMPSVWVTGGWTPRTMRSQWCSEKNKTVCEIAFNE